MNIRRSLTKSRAGHWTLTLTDLDTGHKAYSEKHDTKHGALTEEDELMARLQERAAVAPPVSEAQQAAAEILAEFREQLGEIDEAIARWTRPGIIRGSQWVIRTSEGLYLRRQTNFRGRFSPGGILRAAIWSKEIAASLAADLTDGAGNRGEVAHYLDALRDERATLVRLMGAIEARFPQQPYGPDALPHAVDEDLEGSQALDPMDDVNYVGHPMHY